MTHSFDVEIAKEVGVNAAVIYENILFWCLKNKANNNNFYDGNYWTYNSVRAWRELFPYMGESAIKGALKKLETHGLITSGNYNKSTYDRTKWYSIIHLAISANGLDDNSQPIPYNKPVNKPYNKHTFSFSLKQKCAYDNLSEEYKDKLYGACMLVDGKEDRYEDFLVSLRSNGYQYKNFPLAYMNWDKERAYKNFKTEPEPKLGENWRRVLLGNGDVLAVNSETYETRRGTLS